MENGNNAFELAPIAPPEMHMIGSVISKRHIDIGEEFLSRVKGMLGHVPGKITNYGVKRACASWDSDDETITLDFGNQKLTITLQTKEA